MKAFVSILIAIVIAAMLCLPFALTGADRKTTASAEVNSAVCQVCGGDGIVLHDHKATICNVCMGSGHANSNYLLQQAQGGR